MFLWLYLFFLSLCFLLLTDFLRFLPHSIFPEFLEPAGHNIVSDWRFRYLFLRSYESTHSLLVLLRLLELLILLHIKVNIDPLVLDETTILL